MCMVVNLAYRYTNDQNSLPAAEKRKGLMYPRKSLKKSVFKLKGQGLSHPHKNKEEVHLSKKNWKNVGKIIQLWIIWIIWFFDGKVKVLSLRAWKNRKIFQCKNTRGILQMNIYLSILKQAMWQLPFNVWKLLSSSECDNFI